MKILVTGHAGFIGSHLCEALLKAGHEVTGIDNFNDFYSPEVKKGNVREIEKTAGECGARFASVTADICDEKSMTAIFSQNAFDAVIHLAAMAGVRPSIQNPVLYEKVNGLGTLLLLECARKATIRHFIFGSSSSVYGTNKKIPFAESDPVDLPYSPYAATKRAGEVTCRVYHQLYGMNIAVLRFFTVYGPRQRPDLAIHKFTKLLIEGKTIPILGDGSFKRDFTYVDDIVDGVLKSMKWVTAGLEPKFDIFNLGESATTSVLELIELLEATTGKKAKKEFFPEEPGDVPITFADITKSKKVLGYDPKTELQEGIPLFVEWFKRPTKSNY